MTVALLLARILLALVFAAAGWSKLIDRSGTGEALGAFGVPSRIVRDAAILLPLLELGVAVGLLLPGTGRWPATTAAALLVVFSVGVANSLLHGRRPACHCFGQHSSSPASWATVGRNAALTAIAAFAVAAAPPRESGPARVAMVAILAITVTAFALFLASHRVWWLSLTSLEERAASNAVALAAVRTTMRLAALVGLSGTRARGLPLGSRAPDFRLGSANGTPVTLASLLAEGRPALLVFGDPDCKPCAALAPTVLRWRDELRDQLRVALITRGYAGAAVARDEDAVAAAYEADVTPSAVLISPEGKIASRLAVGEPSIRSLVASVVGPGPAQLRAV